MIQREQIALKLFFRILKLGVNFLVFLFLILMYNSSDGKLFNR